MVYKIITKVIVRRLRPLLDSIISPLQSSFVPNRHTTDNIIIIQEILHHIRKSKAREGGMAMKLDLEKAYDKVDWKSLKQALLKFGFPTKFVNIIIICVTSTSLFILWNGEPTTSFRPFQGDPLSSYLFVIYIKAPSIGRLMVKCANL